MEYRLILDLFIDGFKQRFPERELSMGSDSAHPSVLIDAHDQVGMVEVFDDGDELTVVCGPFTHGHFSDYDDGLSEEQKQHSIANLTLDFLADVFAGRVEFYGTHATGGGWRYRTH